ncbi:hypothetical protein TRFO_17268 [Tritrichomonas foetus]|uniref:Protein kinase domain-containing protein n=1 Tax=Tritrichomonas foetus TaxID=1144522 RepID=A0A1J4KNB0_9EUKA|nr:hypothetical protein TRFO_17268 [Tritrichomonas foetus]|eukprot:OHT12799.1 hypothetical protein TRFO_17268 [Tritrichomonas foetus]
MDAFKFVVDLKNYKVKNKDSWSGSFGRVYVVEEKHTKKLFAAKTLHQSITSVSSQKQFFKEIGVMSHACHPLVVDFVGFNMCDFDNQNKPTIIMEYMPNGSLRDVLDQSRKKKIRFTNTLKQISMIGIAIAVEHLNNENIIHRDVKPQNVLMDDKLHPKLGDFGFSRIFDNDTSPFTTSALGTPIFTAPENIKKQLYSYKVDVYSYAMILYELASGVQPYINAANVHSLYNQVLHGIRPDTSCVKNKSLKKLIQKCWHGNPNKRPSFSEVVHLLITDSSLLLDDVDVNEIDEFLKQFNLKTSYKTNHQIEQTIDHQIEQTIDHQIEQTDSIISAKNVCVYGSNYNSSNHNHITNNINMQEGNNNVKRIFTTSNNEIINKFDIPGYEALNDTNKNLIEQAIGGDLESCTTVAYNLMHGYNDFPKCQKEARKYMKIAVELGDADATNMYAVSLRAEGQKDSAFAYFRRAAELGNTNAMMSLAEMLNNGEGCPVNQNEASQLIQMAADSGNILAIAKMSESSSELVEKISLDNDFFSPRTY